MSSLLLRFLFGPLGRIVPLWFWRAAAVPLAALAWTCGLRRHVTLVNLRLAWPELSERQRRQLGRRAYRRIATVLLELPALRWMSRPKLERTISVENAELLHAAKERGAVLLSAHLGNWELMAIAGGAFADLPVTVIVKPQRDGGVLDAMRSAHGNRTVSIDGAAREATTLLRSGGVVALLADQSTNSPDPLLPFLGVPTYTFATPARLALRYRVPVIIGYAVWENGAYHAQLEQIPTDDLQNTPEGIIELTQRYLDHMERTIRRYPEQWLWTHRKWKHSPGVSYE